MSSVKETGKQPQRIDRDGKTYTLQLEGYDFEMAAVGNDAFFCPEGGAPQRYENAIVVQNKKNPDIFGIFSLDLDK